MPRLLAVLAFILLLPAIARAQQLSSSDYIAITFMVLGSILATVVIFMIIHHHVKNKEKVASDPRVSTLKKSFKEYLDRGYTKKQVIDAALKQGWPPNMVESAMKSV